MLDKTAKRQNAVLRVLSFNLIHGQLIEYVVFVSMFYSQILVHNQIQVHRTSTDISSGTVEYQEDGVRDELS